MSKIGGKLVEELRILLPIMLYFTVAFELIALTEALLLGARGIHVSSFLNALLGALVVSKVVVLADHVPFVERFQHRPPVVNALWKTAIYVVGSLIVRYAERLLHAWGGSAGLAEAHRRVLAEVSWPHFWTVQLWVVLILLGFACVREMSRALGRERAIALFFHEPAARSGTTPHGHG